ncbi:hypothetical protein [Tenacibaculum maritimum]|uniref:hypothetical protein n=1 Tax=Tenacibaculum maritimum TaxID=107401 RepID=UPI0012E49749|nr:hypothetical protein [Tenacibaculum maritimum]CAA0230047.1 conserved hypothetical protein [Tenacibaculum maritimum]CAA0250347.1 conserved hypothetical protein [Tenacibaculum maritimum]
MTKDIYNRAWITKNAIEEIETYEKGVLTLRGLHYRLVSRGMTNTTRHYKRVVSAMIKARWEGLVDFDTFSDHDRGMLGETNSDKTNLEDKISEAKKQLGLWMKSYYKNKWENQPYYPEVFIEKKALQGIFEKACFPKGVALGACKGYPSLTFLNEAAERFKAAKRNGKKPVILYFGDYDPSGEDIPRSIKENLKELGVPSIKVKRISLLHEQVLQWKLPPAPVKVGDSRSANWDGLGQVELDAVEPNKLKKLCREAIDSIFDYNLYDELNDIEDKEREIYQRELKDYVNNGLS